MGNRSEEDYNFVFKGESGSIKKETSRARKHPLVLFLFLSLTWTPKGSSFALD